MKTPRFNTAIAIVGPVIAAASANADTVTANFSYEHAMKVRVQSVPMTGNVNTVSFNWTRRDTPGPGIDTTVPRQYPSFCVELDQHVRRGATYTYNVLSPAAYGFSPDAELALQSLWASHINDLTTSDNACAFQLAVWEIRYDTNRNLSGGAFSASGAANAISIAQSWLNSISSTTTLRDLPTLCVLANPNSQDQITIVPQPSAIVCMLAGAAMLRRRKTR